MGKIFGGGSLLEEKKIWEASLKKKILRSSSGEKKFSSKSSSGPPSRSLMVDPLLCYMSSTFQHLWSQPTQFCLMYIALGSPGCQQRVHVRRLTRHYLQCHSKPKRMYSLQYLMGESKLYLFYSLNR